MEKALSIELNNEKKISVWNRKREVIRIDEVLVHTIQNPEMIFRDFKKDGDAFGSQTHDIKARVGIYEDDGIVAFSFGSSILSREDNWGYPDAFTAGNCMEISLVLNEDMPFAANYQHKRWWLRPAFGTSFAEIPEKTQLLILKKENRYQVFLAVCGDEVRADLAGMENGLRILLSSGQVNRKIIQETAVIWGYGEDPYEVIERCVKLAKKLKNNSFMLRREKQYPAVFENIGWCTWDSLGQDVSEEAIIAKMEEFREKDIVIPWILIDDGWSYVDKEHLTLKGLDADPIRFPNGLAGTVKILKEKYKVSYVGVWQAFKGYWNGLEENSEAYHIMAPYITRYGNGEISVKPTEEASFGFWNRWHRELKQKGIDFVKVDGQSSVPSMICGYTISEAPLKALHTGLEASVFLNFEGNLINCMGMSPENVWNRQCSAVSRTSDDYIPAKPDGFDEHALQNCYSSVYQGELYVGDYDMFWSDHEDAQQSAVLRVISGGPVYISDSYGRTCKAELDKIIRSDGSLLRCDGIGKPTLDCLMEDALHNEKILKVCNKCDETIFIACFTGSFSKKWAESVIKLEDIPDVKYDRYYVHDWHTHELGTCERDAEYSFSMGSRQAKLLQLVPVEKDITVLGMVDKYISRASVDYIHRFQNICFIKVNCSGKFGFIPVKKIERVYVNQAERSYKKENEVYLIEVIDENAEIAIIW